MLQKYLQNDILAFFPHSAGIQQIELSGILAEFTSKDTSHPVCIIKGYAGTGKTSLLSAYVKTLKKLKIKFVLLAPTGRAAKVFSSFSGFPAYTIHKQIYRQKSASDTRFVINYKSMNDTVFIVDESSMIQNEYSPNSVFGSGRLLDDLMEYVFKGKNCRLILSGDSAQLPPVGTELSPALDIPELESRGLQVSSYEMTDVVRQSAESGILHNATHLREHVRLNQFNTPHFELEGFSDIHQLGGAGFIEELESCYDRDGVEKTCIICRSNKRANYYNQGIRNQLFWYEEEINQGDLLMVVKNNYYWVPENSRTDFIANGDILEVVRTGQIHDMYGFRFMDVLARFIDYPEMEMDTRIILDSLTSEQAALSEEQHQQLYTQVLLDYQHLKNRKDIYKAMRKDPFYNALQVKYAYALTCHKSQGGQWKNVFIDQGYVKEDMINRSYFRWLYTALTRSYGQTWLLNFPENYFSSASS